MEFGMSRRIKPKRNIAHFSDGKFANLDGPPKKDCGATQCF